MLFALSITLNAQSPANIATDHPAAAPTVLNAQSQPSAAADSGPITEVEPRQRLVGQTFYMRGSYLDNSLHFNETGQLVSNSPQVSYTLSLVEISKAHLGKHKLELECVRYGLHFLDGLPSFDPMQAANKVRLTPKKKTLKITIDREVPVKPKKEKASKSGNTKDGTNKPATEAQPTATVDQENATAERDGNRTGGTTTSPAHANRVLRTALDNVFARGLDERMVASLPDYWKLYFRAAQKSDNRPTDPSVLRQSEVDRKAKLLFSFEAPSNEFAQTNGVAGIAVFHVVVSPEGKASEIAVARPIGFGLDENAVASIRKASFQPALKDGKPVPVLLDVTIQFRIYSKRTAAAANPDSTKVGDDQPATPSLPGPYSANNQ